MRLASALALTLLLAATSCRSVRPGVAPEPASVDLLALVDPEEHVLQGQWSRVEGALVSTTERATANRYNSWFHVPVELPAEFDLTLVAERLDESDMFTLCFRHLGRKYNVFLDRERSTKSGLSPIDGLDFDEGETLVRHNRPVFPTGETVTLRISARESGVRVTADDWVLVDWRGTLDRLGGATWLDLWTTQSLLVGSRASEFRITRMDLTPIGPARRR